MDGLIIKRKWLDKIISGQKTEEIRGRNTSKTGERILLLESGSQIIRGTCIIRSAHIITAEEWDRTRDKHLVKLTWGELVKIYPVPWAWEIESVTANTVLEYYRHPSGAVIWVKNVERVKHE